MISIIIPVHNGVEYTRMCLAAVRMCTEDFEIIVVDNGSTDETKDATKGENITYLRNEKNKGFPRAVNRGAASANGEYLCVLNNDVVVTPGWAERMIGHIEAGHADIIGPCTNIAAGRQRVLIDAYGSNPELFAASEARFDNCRGDFERVNWIIGFCMVLRKSTFLGSGGFDTMFGLGNSEDIDFCMKAGERGFDVGIARDVYVHHFGGVTHALLGLDYKELLRANHRKLLNKWGEDHERLKQEIG